MNTDKAAENPALAAFVDYYTGDAGYAAVARRRLRPDARGRTSPPPSAAWEDAGGTPGEPEPGVSGEVVISGSSTVEPISSAVAEGFSADNPDVSISVDGPGTGDGFELFCGGETDISDASRPIEDEEIAACEDAGINYIEIQIGLDGLPSSPRPDLSPQAREGKQTGAGPTTRPRSLPGSFPSSSPSVHPWATSPADGGQNPSLGSSRRRPDARDTEERTHG